MKHTQYFLLAMLSLLLFSCNEEAKTLNPVLSKISGPLADCFEVVVKDYKIIGNQVNLEFVRIKEGEVEPQITAEFLDENGNVLITTNADKNSNKKDLRFLLANKVGESSTVAFAVGNANPKQVRFIGSTTIEENNEVTEMAIKSEVVPEDVDVVEETEVPTTIEEATEVDEEVEDEDEDEEEIEEESQQVQSSINNKDWDKVLDDFESYVDHYISLLKKATNGDLSALTEYAAVLEKAEKLEKDLNAAQNEMTNAQMKRYVRITKKMTDAAFDMYDKMY